MEDAKLSRRDFMRKAAATAVAAKTLTIIGAGAAHAQSAKAFKIGLIGCGGRGNGALRNCLAAGKQLKADMRVVALADAYKDRADRCRQGMKKEGHEVPEDRCYVGFDAYKKLIATDVDIVLLATPPNFRPVHFAACVEAGKHVFMEKPVAVDPVGCRRIMAASKEAKKKGLSVVAGTQRRHQAAYVGTHKVIAEGAIGRILAGQIYWCGGRLWYRERKPEWDDAEYLVRNWVSFTEMSGDHIVEQHVHNIDVANWFIGAHPVAAVAFGGRARRRTGDQYDFFSVDFEYPDGVHVHSMCRQVSGCWNRVGENLVGEKGTTNCRGRVKTQAEVKIPKVAEHGGPYVQEHIDLLDSILKGKPLNEAQNVAESTMSAVMARISAYTGKRVTWDEMMKSDMVLKPAPEDFEAGKVTAPKDDVVPVPGKA